LVERLDARELERLALGQVARVLPQGTVYDPVQDSLV
jgi:hypothetical protein